MWRFLCVIEVGGLTRPDPRSSTDVRHCLPRWFRETGARAFNVTGSGTARPATTSATELASGNVQAWAASCHGPGPCRSVQREAGALRGGVPGREGATAPRAARWRAGGGGGGGCSHVGIGIDAVAHSRGELDDALGEVVAGGRLAADDHHPRHHLPPAPRPPLTTTAAARLADHWPDAAAYQPQRQMRLQQTGRPAQSTELGFLLKPGRWWGGSGGGGGKQAVCAAGGGVAPSPSPLPTWL